jgi:glucokinase
VTAVAAAVDIGGTKIAAALVTRSGAVVERRSTPTPARAGGRAVLAAAGDLVEELRSGSGAELVALGIGSAGVVDPGSGRVLAATDQLADWAGTNLTELGDRWQVPVAAMNDVHAHALGEAFLGSGSEAPTMLFLAVGTGIGGAYVVDGSVLPGAHFVAGHAGHVPSSYAAGVPCTCGGSGHLEAVASGPALVAEYRRRTGNQADDLPAVAARAAGDSAARDVLEYGGRAVGSALGGLVTMLDPHLVVVGGGVTGVGELWWNALRTELRRETLTRLADVPVRAARLGNDGALIGAAMVAWERTS